MICPILQLGDVILRTPADAVIDFTDPVVKALCQNLSDTLQDSGGIGIAAPQIGISLQIIIISPPNDCDPEAPSIPPVTMINPIIAARSESIEKGWEGCLSIPTIRGLVPRSKHVRVSYIDAETFENREEDFEDFAARIVQHEIDHLNGAVFVDRLETTLDLVTEQEYRKIIDTAKKQAQTHAESGEQAVNPI